MQCGHRGYLTTSTEFRAILLTWHIPNLGGHCNSVTTAAGVCLAGDASLPLAGISDHVTIVTAVAFSTGVWYESWYIRNDCTKMNHPKNIFYV